MKLAVPHPGHFSALKELIENKTQEVKEVYMAGSSDVMGSGRATLYASTVEEIAEQTEYAHEHGIEMNIILNSSCIGGEHLSFEGYNRLKRYLEALNKSGVDAVTVAEPYLVELISQEFPDIRVDVSCVATVDSVQRAMFFEELGADVITVDTNINRDFEMLGAIKRGVKCGLKLIVNEGCLYKCPFRYAHFNLFSHVTVSGLKPQIFGDYYFDKCISIRVRDPEQIIKSPWIRPEDIKEYERIGIDYFKIAGRANTVCWIINCVKAYSERRYRGNLLNLLDCPSELRDLFYIENEDLDGCIDKWKGCKKICYECGYCKGIAKKVVRVMAL